MIDFTSIGDFSLKNKEAIEGWITFVIEEEEKEVGEINYIFCDDDYLLEINRKELKHNTLTDIISLDYTIGDVIFGDIYISYERIRSNAVELQVDDVDELHRVMVHGVLHYCGYKDKTDDEKKQMRRKEDYYLSLRTF